MNILVTGANGFLGKNLCLSLGTHNVLKFERDTDMALLDEYCKIADFVFHLACVIRPSEDANLMKENVDFTAKLLGCLKKHANKCPIAYPSSTQAVLDNPYGRSKRDVENMLNKYSSETGASVFIYRFPNIFGKWSRPNYNSAIATFCHNIARGLPITVSNPNIELTLVYIDDVIDELLNVMNGSKSEPPTQDATLGTIVSLLYGFKKSREDLAAPEVSDPFVKKLHATYLSYLPTNDFSYPLKMNVDARGSFTEILRTMHHGQFSVNVTKPGITKGNHWHNTKCEKFLTVYGEGIVNFRRIDSGKDEIIEYKVSAEKMEVVDVPPGYTHNIVNTGNTDLVMLMWCNEAFNPEKPDTTYLEV